MEQTVSISEPLIGGVGRTTQRLIDAAQGVWDECLASPFVQAIADGSLDRDLFKYYIIQDYMYIREYAKVFAVGVAKAHNNEVIRLFNSYVNMLVEYELDTHNGYIAKFGVTEEEIENTPMGLPNLSYTSYMLRVAYEETAVEALVAILPCALTYEWIAKKLVAENPQCLEDEFYGPWIKAYAFEYGDYNVELNEMLEKLTADYTEEQLVHLEEIFVACSRYEQQFWAMAWGGKAAW